MFRIEDTDAARDSEESYDAILEALRWLGLDWDEGPEVGGPHSPTASLSVESSTATSSPGSSSPARPTSPTPRRTRWRPGTSPPDATPNSATTTSTATSPTPSARTLRPQGRKPVLRLRMPDEDITWHDLVRGETTFGAGTVPDFALTRASGDPLYTLVNPVDDALMRITHVLRGEDLLPSTPRQIALHRALIRSGREVFPNTRICQRFWGRAPRSCPSAIRSPTCSCTATAGSCPRGC